MMDNININTMAKGKGHNPRRRKVKRVGTAIFAGCLLYIASFLSEPPSYYFDNTESDDHGSSLHRGRSLLIDSASELPNNHPESMMENTGRFPFFDYFLFKTGTSLAGSDIIQVPRFGRVWPCFDYLLFKTGRHSSKTSLMMSKSKASHHYEHEATRINSQAPAMPVKPYDAATALYTNQNFGHTLMLTIFLPSDGTLVTYGDASAGYNKFRGYSTSYILSRALMQNFPQRFQKDGRPFQILFTSADLPPVLNGCLDKNIKDYNELCRGIVDEFAPVITFGSAPKETSILPSLHQFPLTNFMSCFETQDCKMTIPLKGRLPNWKDLIPQIKWRGSDFHTARSMGYGHWRPGHSYQDVDPAVMSREEVIDGLLSHYRTLTPRWRVVVQSLKASLDAEVEQQKNGGGEEILPWIDAKFLKNSFNKMYAQYDPFLERYEARGIPVVVEERMTERELSMYKYHLDVGGGSGTTWEGTLRKLAMPGLLFHHETPTKDFFYDEIEPWVHYVPVKMDLSDLREKFDWAESHPQEAEAIAKTATEYISHNMGTDDWIERTYDKYFVKELGRIVDAYRPTEGETVASITDGYMQSIADSSRGLRVYSKCGRNGCTMAHHDGSFYKAFDNNGRHFVD